MRTRGRTRSRSALVVGLWALAMVGCESEESVRVLPTESALDAEPFPPVDVDPLAERPDVGCARGELGEDVEIRFVTAHLVVDGTLGALCLGAPEPALVEAWSSLAVIAPPGQLGDLGVFSGFESTEAGDEVTLAFVSPLDADGSLFQMAVNLDAAIEDADELLVTMAHELTHVFTATPQQLDRTDEAIDSCATYFSGDGCYLPDSLMWAWIQEFWGDAAEEVDPLADPTGATGQARCDADAGFFGAYAASNPEEDFAEAFSAFVFRIDAESAEQQARLDWMADQSGLLEFRRRAEDAGVGPLPHTFDACGQG